MKRVAALILVLVLLGSCHFAVAEQTLDTGASAGSVVSLVPYDNALLCYISKGQVFAFDPAFSRQYPVTFELDWQKYNRAPPFTALFLGPEQRLYGAIGQDNAYRIYRGGSAGSDMAMQSIGDMTLPWEGKHVYDFMACAEGIAVTCENDIFCWNPDTGAAFFWQNCGFEKIISDGSRLLAYRPGHADSTELVELHPATQSVSTLYAVDDKPWLMAASPDGRWISCLPYGRSIITARRTGEKDRMGYMSKTSDWLNLPCCLTNAGVFAFAEGDTIYYEQLSDKFDPDHLGLMVARFPGDPPGTDEFRKAHPEIRVTTREVGGRDAYNPAVAAEWIRSGDDITDLFVVGSDAVGFEAMLKKGYCTDLSGDEELAALIRAMPAYIKACVMEGDKILGMPLDGAFMSSFLGVNPAALEAAGLTMADIPGNVDELLDRLIAWMEDGTLAKVRLDDASRSDPGTFAEVFVQRF